MIQTEFRPQVSQLLRGGGTNYIKGNKDIDTLDSVNVTYNETAQVSASERAKIIPENIVKGVNILGVTGTAEGGGGTNVFYINCAVNNLDEKVFLPIAETPTRQEVYEAIVAGKTVLARAKIQNQEWDVDYNYYALFVGCFGVSSLECTLYYISDEMIKLDMGARNSQMFSEE